MEKRIQSHQQENVDSNFCIKKCPSQTMNRDQLEEHIKRKHDLHVLATKCS